MLQGALFVVYSKPVRKKITVGQVCINWLLIST